MFQYEVRETVAILLNVITAIVVTIAAVAMLRLNTKVGTIQTERYIAEQRLSVKYEYSACDTKVLTYDELRAYFADYIKDGLTIYIAIDANGNAKLDSGETYYAWDKFDYDAKRSNFDIDNLKLSLPKPIKQIYNSSTGNPPANLIVQEAGENADVRYIAKLIYDNSDPLKQEQGQSFTSNSYTVSGVLFLKSNTTGVSNLYT